MSSHMIYYQTSVCVTHTYNKHGGISVEYQNTIEQPPGTMVPWDNYCDKLAIWRMAVMWRLSQCIMGSVYSPASPLFWAVACTARNSRIERTTNSMSTEMALQELFWQFPRHMILRMNSIFVNPRWILLSLYHLLLFQSFRKSFTWKRLSSPRVKKGCQVV